jgi:GDPmannose 4,6-dehydratase
LNIIIGSDGQDGRILSAKLRSRGEQVITVNRYDFAGFLCNFGEQVVNKKDTTIFFLAGFSSVWRSWEQPHLAVERNLNTFVELLERVRLMGFVGKVMLASSSEIFDPGQGVVTEITTKSSSSPYGVSKLAAYRMGMLWREAYGINITAIHMFNHESPLRKMDFLSQKIANGVARISLGLTDTLTLGRLDLLRDWGYAPDFVDAMILARSVDMPEFLVSTGQVHSIEELLEAAFLQVGIEDWQGLVTSSSENLRPIDHDGARGDYSLIKNQTGWTPTKQMRDVIAEMVDHQRHKIMDNRDDLDWLQKMVEK